MSDWISVEDRLPEIQEGEDEHGWPLHDAETYIVYGVLNGERKVTWATWMRDMSGVPRWVSGEGYACGVARLTDVSHWMPLPDPPSASEEA